MIKNPLKRMSLLLFSLQLLLELLLMLGFSCCHGRRGQGPDSLLAKAILFCALLLQSLLAQLHDPLLLLGLLSLTFTLLLSFLLLLLLLRQESVGILVFRSWRHRSRGQRTWEWRG